MNTKRNTLGNFTHFEIASALASLTPITSENNTWTEKKAFMRLNGQLFSMPADWNYGRMCAAARLIGGEIILVEVSLTVAIENTSWISDLSDEELINQFKMSREAHHTGEIDSIKKEALIRGITLEND